LNGNFLDFNDKVKRKVIHQRSNFIVQDDEIYTHDGENISHLYELSLNPIYISEKKNKEYQSKLILGKHEQENGGFVFMFYNSLCNMLELLPSLSKVDMSRLIFLTTYISYEENKIQYDNGKEITDKNLMELLRLNRNTYKPFIKKLVANKILNIDENGNKFLSQAFCKYGSINSKSLKDSEICYVRMFKKSIRDMFNETTIRELGRLSIIYLILPYLNRVTNIISYNPSEEDTKLIEPIPISDLANKFGYSDHVKFRKMMYGIKIGDSQAFGFFMKEEDKGLMRIVVNPKIVFAGNAEQLLAIEALFNN